VRASIRWGRSSARRWQQGREVGGLARGGRGGGVVVDAEQCWGKRRESPGMRYERAIAAKCSNTCGICWSRYSAPSIFILQMKIYLQHLMEIV
jgi:hypothetical protein